MVISLLRCSDVHTSAGAKVAAPSTVTATVDDIHREQRKEPSDSREKPGQNSERIRRGQRVW